MCIVTRRSVGRMGGRRHDAVISWRGCSGSVCWHWWWRVCGCRGHGHVLYILYAIVAVVWIGVVISVVAVIVVIVVVVVIVVIVTSGAVASVSITSAFTTAHALFVAVSSLMAVTAVKT